MPNYQNFYHVKNSINRCGRRLSEVVVPFYNIVGSSRVSSKMRYTCDDEVIYDSYVPRIDEILLTEGAYPCYQSFHVSSSTGSPQIDVGVYLFSTQPATWNKSSTYPSKNPKYSSWFSSYPYESKYSNLQRATPPSSYKSYDFDGTEKYVNYITFQFPTGIESSSTSEAGVRKMLYDELFQVSSSLNSTGSQVVPPSNNEIYKFFFGIGDEKNCIFGSSDQVLQTFVGAPTFFNTDSIKPISPLRLGTTNSNLYPTTLYAVCGVSISGWKYGIYNGLPTSTTCVFRRNSYGQFRDMLEQRPFTVFVDQVAKKPLAGPVEVKFVKLVQSGSTENRAGSYISVDPYQVDTLNKSTFATSSIPYFDY